MDEGFQTSHKVGIHGEGDGITSTTVDDEVLMLPVADVPLPQPMMVDGRGDCEPPAKRRAQAYVDLAGLKISVQALSSAARCVESGSRSPVAVLNELGINVVYRVLRQEGPAHAPSFDIAVSVADMSFEGWGRSKREARAAAARVCLNALLSQVGRVMKTDNGQVDFTKDEFKPLPATQLQCIEAKMPLPKVFAGMKRSLQVTAAAPSPTACGPFDGAAAPAEGKSPINCLYERFPGLNFNVTYGDGSPLEGQLAPAQIAHSMRFKVVCNIRGKNFEGYGSSKKLAKLAACRAALAELHETEARTVDRAPDASAAHTLPQTIADLVGKLVNEKFNKLMKDDATHVKRKVLAGIVMTTDYKKEGAKVIAVTTGTKCVSGEHMSVRGLALNDCHAEVVARRCLQRYLYRQLAMYARLPPAHRGDVAESAVEPAPGGGYRLRPDRKLHLYVSTAPCGDGRIFSPHEDRTSAPDKHPNRAARGQLRTKIESGEGTIPVKNSSNLIQTWDGVLQGERLLTMSCSDKVARWCVLGLQGSLLSAFLEPVYLDSLVLGSLLHPDHMYRALCGRIEHTLSALAPPFRLHRPKLARAASLEARTPQRAPNFSVNWTDGSLPVEVVNATTGKLESGRPSVVCKQAMFARWQHVAARLQPLEQPPAAPAPAPTLMGGVAVAPRDIVALRGQLPSMLYDEAKQLATGYQVSKARLLEAFERAQLGRWVQKPLEQDQFVAEPPHRPDALFL